MGSVVVDDDVDDLAGRRYDLDGVKEPNELLMAVALHTATDDPTVEHVQGDKQRGGAAALIVVRHRTDATLLHRQARLSAIERLDLRFLVDREHDGVRRRVDIQTDSRSLGTNSGSFDSWTPRRTAFSERDERAIQLRS